MNRAGSFLVGVSGENPKMSVLTLPRDAIRPSGWPRTLMAYAGAVWLWPGIPLTVEKQGIVEGLSLEWVRFWVVKLHGFEAQHSRVESAIARAAHCLTLGHEGAAQQALDASKLDRLSPEGATLMSAVAARLDIEAVALPIGVKSLPWGAGDVHSLAKLFDPFASLATALEKEWEESQHPRWPAGAPAGQGGRFAPGQGSSSAPGATTPSPPSVENPRAGIGHNGGPSLDDTPEVPQEEPATAQLRNAIIKDVAKWLLRRGVLALIPGAGEAMLVIQLGVWLYKYFPYINAYLQKPQTLEELEEAATQPKMGYDIHHIVEQTPARQAGFSNSEIEASENKVRISTLKHWEISGWYNMSNPEFGELSPRDYLNDKDWAERVRVGREALMKFGVLKP